MKLIPDVQERSPNWRCDGEAGDCSNGVRLGLLLRFVRLAVVLGLAAQASAEARHFETITVRVYNYAHAPGPILAKAEQEATEVLSAAGVGTVWIDCLDSELSRAVREVCEKGWSVEVPSLRLLPGQATKQFQNFEFGFADVPAFATISYDHIVRRAERDSAPMELPVVLGCVMAHELGHLLLGDPKHSSTGIMQSKWGSKQIQQALTGQLRFTAEESQRIGKRAQELARARVGAVREIGTVNVDQ